MATTQHARLTLGSCALALLAGSASAAVEPLDCFVAPALVNIDDAPGSRTEKSQHNFVCHTTEGEHVLLTNQPQAETLRIWDQVELEADLPPAEERQWANQSAHSPESVNILRVTPRAQPLTEDLAMPELSSDDSNATDIIDEHERARNRRLQGFQAINDVRLMHAIRLQYTNGVPRCSETQIENDFHKNSGRNIANFFLEKSYFKVDLRRKTGPSGRALDYAFTVRMNKRMPTNCANLRAEINRAGQLAWSQLKIRTDQVSHLEVFVPEGFPSCGGFQATGNYACNLWDGNRIVEKRGACFTIIKDRSCSMQSRIAALARNMGLLRATAYTYPNTNEADQTSVMGGFMGRRSVGPMRIFSAPEMYRSGWMRSKVRTHLGGASAYTLAPLNFPENFVRQYVSAVRVPATGCTSGAASGGYFFISLRGAYDDSWYENLPSAFADKIVIQHAGGRGVDLVATLRHGEQFVTKSNFAIVRCSPQSTYVQVAIAKFSGDNWQAGVNLAKSKCRPALANSAVKGVPWSCATAATRTLIGKQQWPRRGESWCESSARNTPAKCERYTAVDYWSPKPIIFQASPCQWKAGKCKWMDNMKLTCPMYTRASNCSITDNLKDLRSNGLTFEFKSAGSWCGSQRSRGTCERSMAVTDRDYSNGGRGKIYYEERQRCRWRGGRCELSRSRGDIAWCVV